MKYNKFLTIASLAVFFSSVQASNLQVKITNSASVPVAFVLVPTELNTDYGQIYRGSSDIPRMVEKIKAFVLTPQESTTLTNFPQKIREYDRVLWIVPLDVKKNIEPYLQSLGISVTNGAKQAHVQAFEVGSAKGVQIMGDATKLSLNTSGKLLGGVKSMFKGSKSSKAAGTTRGYSLRELTEGIAIAPLKRQLENWEKIKSPETVKATEPKKTYAKPPTPRRNPSQAIAKGNPEGWPTDVPGNPSFNDAAKTLKLSNLQAKQLMNYKNMTTEAQGKLLSDIDSKVDKGSKSERYARQAVRKYMLNVVDPYTVHE